MKFVTLFFLILFSAEASISLRSKHPLILLTEDFGILTERDVIENYYKSKDISSSFLTTYYRGFARWQCMDISKVKFDFHTWRSSDPMGRADSLVELCTFSFEVEESAGQSFMSRRAHRSPVCKRLAKIWKKSTVNEKKVCLKGYPINFDGHKFNDWWFDSFKTKSGSY